MNIPFTTSLVIEFILLISYSESWPNWHWGHSSRPRSGYCSVGHCIPVWQCPDYSIAIESTGHCAHLEDGPYVCCIDQDSSYKRTTQYPKIHSTKAPGKPSKMTPYTTSKPTRTTLYKNQWVPENTVSPQKSKFTYSTSSTTKHIERGNDVFMTTSSSELWNRNSKEKSTLTSSYWKKTTESTWNRPTWSGSRSKSTNIPFSEEKKKTTKSTWQKQQTTRSGVASTTAQPKIKFTPNFWEKISTSRPVINLITNIWRKSSVPSMKNKTTTIPRVTASTSNSTIKSTKIPENKSTPKTWRQQPTRSTSKNENRETTRSSGRLTPKTTQVSLVRTSTMNARYTSSTTKVTRTNQVWPESHTKAVLGGTRSTTAKPKRGPPKVGHVRTTANLKETLDTIRRATTRNYKVTTPLPDINNHVCGIRQRQPVRNQPGRNNRRTNPDSAVIFRDSRENEGRRPFQRIVGGREAEPFSWPWVAALYKVTDAGGNRFLSAGSLINENFVLTAAHVFTPDDLRTSTYVVMLGTHTTKEAFAEYVVSSVLQHPEYQHRYYYNDIALLKLQRPVQFNDYVMPICLPSPDAPLLKDRDLVGKNVTVMGWGDDSFGGKSSRVLKEATIPVVSRHACNASYVQVASNRFPKGITDQMLCAGAPNGGKDACQGDSGGPLTTLENGRYTQVGIVSFGYKCGDKEYPGVYTKVAPYLKWIAENTLHAAVYGDYES